VSVSEVLGLRSSVQRERMAAEMEVALRRHVADVWFPRCVDTAAGGFLCSFDRRWRAGQQQQRLLEFQARQTRVAATLARAYPEQSRWADHALTGYTCLRDVMWDHRHGGWFRSVDRDGVPLDEATKHAHGSAYAVQACIAVSRATGDAKPLDLASEAVEWWMRRGHDDTWGGLHNWLRREGAVIRTELDVPAGLAARDPLGQAVGLKDINVLGDWVEALTDLRVAAPGWCAEPLEELLRIYVERATTVEGEVHYAFAPDWTPVPGAERMGYSFQTVHRMLRSDLAPAWSDRLRVRAHAVIRHAVERASMRGGGFAHIPVRQPGTNGGTLADRRVWWVQFEALRALAHVARDDGTAVSADALRAHWKFIRRRMLDHVYGGVFDTCLADLRTWERRARRRATTKGNEWKDASHETHALLTTIDILRISPRANT
jgi:mannose/cellobiose epimerase-like protein (N-acyl-D-glucosamine 2-epimerase family)